MTDAIVGTGSIVGFDVNSRDSTHSLLSAVDRGEHTRDILQGQRFEAEHLRDSVSDVAVAVEKTGAATALAVEKIGAATQLASAQQFTVLQLQAANLASAAAAQAAECCCEVKELVREDGSKTRDLINSIERDRQSTLLADCKNELLVARLSGAVAPAAR